MRKVYISLIGIVVIVFTIMLLYHLNSESNVSSEDLLNIATSSSNNDMSQSSSPTAPLPTHTPAIINNEYYISLLSPIDDIISSDINSGFPGAVLLISLDGETIFKKAYGYLKIYDGYDTVSPPTAMQEDTVFDIASLTKIYSTTLSIMKLVDSGLMSLDDYVYQYLPDFNKAEYSDITIRQLLNHTSGLPSNIYFYRPDVKEGEAFYSTERDKTISLLSEVPLKESPGKEASYSDIGYMVLSSIIEKLTDSHLDDFADRYIYSPLSLADSIGYTPLNRGFDINNIACTERLGNSRDGLVDFPYIRRYTLQGEVHDEKAYYCMGGVSGHAGLFANADAINTLNLMLLNDGTYGYIPILSQATVSIFTEVDSTTRYQLGFANAKSYETLAETVPDGTLCHTGWTGAFSLIDKESNLSIVLLTNKRHSPITDGKFEGELFETGRYFSLVKAIYEALNLG